MDKDEQAIRSLVATWMQATADGDLARVLELMADDVVFLGAGRPPMREKDAFAAATRAMEGRARAEGNVDAQEVPRLRRLGVELEPDDRHDDARRRRGTQPADWTGLSILRKRPDGRG